MNNAVKKNRAIVLGATGNIAFSVAHMVMQLKQYMYDDIDNIIIFYDQWLDSDIEIIKSICDKCIFIHYSFDFFLERMKTQSIDSMYGGLQEWKHLVYSIYELFNLLEKYHKVLWLDCDIIIRGNFRELFNFNKVAMRRGTILKLSKALGISIENDEYIYNSGVVLVSDDIKYDNITTECYDITRKQFDVIKYPDQTILTYICNKYKINVNDLPSDYHYYATATANDNFYSAKIIHTPAENKPWNNALFSLMFPEFYTNYQKWLALGGSSNANKERFFFDEVGDSPAHFFSYIKHSIDIVSIYNKYINKIHHCDLYCKLYIHESVIRFIFNSNKNIFYKFSIGKATHEKYKKYGVSICTHNPSDLFLSFLDDVKNTFHKINPIVVSQKKYQYIKFIFHNDTDAVFFLNMLIHTTSKTLKDMMIAR